MRLRIAWDRERWGRYAAELLIVAAGVALGLWATEWAAERQAKADVADAKQALHDELTDNFEVIRYRKQAEPCVRRRIADLRAWIVRHRAGERSALPGEIGRPGAYAILDSVWDVSKAGQAAAKMPLEERRRYAAVYDVLESFSNRQMEERDVWFEINDFAGRADLSAAELGRLNGLVGRAAAIDLALNTNYATLTKDLGLLGVRPSQELSGDSSARRILCAPFVDASSAPSPDRAS